jgi:site-specific DNA-methyltransferase (adenine-specific)
MEDIPDRSVHLVLADLPYGTTDRSGKKGSRIFKWDSPIPMGRLWEQYKRILTPRGAVVLTADQPFTSTLITSNLEWFKYDMIWKKSKTTGFLTANYRPMKCTEDIVVFSPAGAAAASRNSEKGNMTYNPQGLIPKVVKKKNNPKRLGKILGVEKFIGKNNKLLSEKEYEQKFTNYPNEILEFASEKNTTHPTQKPVGLMSYLINTYSNPGETVLDNVMGSGTTGVAAVMAGRNFIGIEKNEEYYVMAEQRINEVRKSEGLQRTV